jgi:gliding motility-associated-like protein
LKRIIVIALGLWVFLFLSLSQNVTMPGILNGYLKVDEVLTNGVRVTQTAEGELSPFMPGDKVLLIQMTGVTIIDTLANPNFKTSESRTRQSFNNAGRFEILQVDMINTSGADTLVYFTDNVSNTYNNNEKIQLVRFVEGDTVIVNGLVMARKWDGRVGGIVAIIGTESVKLNGNIDVSGQGFRGGNVPAETYPGGCRNDAASDTRDTLYFLPTQIRRSGNKGEGIVTASWPFTKGTAFSINGGGAGNGLYSGGGGGSNYSLGGDGGRQSASCISLLSVYGGWGGYACQELYSDPAKPRIIMGGGGGSGTRMNTAPLSKGGDGGGMVILITGNLIAGNGYSIKSNGVNASSTQGSGGGGGAGGTIVIDVTSYTGSPFTVSVKGGNGGTTTTTPCNGAGGGGSGGVLWYAGNNFPTTNLVDISIATGGGTYGGVLGCPTQMGINGRTGVKFSSLILPLNGFLFNSIRGTDTVCAGQVPNNLTASQPKGGNGIYDHTWQQSTDSINWVNVPGLPLLRTFQPEALTQTTWYRRIVTSDTIADTSRVIKIFVYPAIGNNSITGADSICYNSNAKPVNGSTPTGGNNTYNYFWQESNNQTNWDTVGRDVSFDPAILTSSTYYRRLVTSTAYCYNTSNTVLITVLPSISGNGFNTNKTDTAICMNSSPGQLNALKPGGGDGSYSYLWQNKTLSGDWTSIPSSDVMKYTAGILSDTTAYRRIVFSGNDNACIDTSEAKAVNTRPLITHNNILGDPVQYACYNSPVNLSGSIPHDGFNTYAYGWEQSNDNSIWGTTSGTEQNYRSSSLTNTRYFRRAVYSTPQYHECVDVSNTVEVRINPLPAGNVINNNDTLCAGETLYVKFNLAGNGPFNVTIDGVGIPDQSKTGINSLYDSIAFVPVSTLPFTVQPFTMYSVEDDSGCFAAITGFTDTATAVVYKVPIADAGDNATICGEKYTLHANFSIQGNAAGLWTAEGALFDHPENPNTLVTSDTYGSKVFTWTETNWRCKDNDAVEITFQEQPQSPNAGPDQALDFNYTTQLHAVPASVGKGKWTLITGTGEFDNDTLPDAVISELANSTMLKWTVINGNCPAVADSMVILINPLLIKKGFTPNNGDKKNDYFDIGAHNAERISLKVFNSAGVLVYESDDYKGSETEGWDGRNMHGVQLPEGTYFYIANIKVAGKKQEVQFRSFVEIMR